MFTFCRSRSNSLIRESVRDRSSSNCSMMVDELEFILSGGSKSEYKIALNEC